MKIVSPIMVYTGVWSVAYAAGTDGIQIISALVGGFLLMAGLLVLANHHD